MTVHRFRSLNNQVIKFDKSGICRSLICGLLLVFAGSELSFSLYGKRINLIQ